jgi:16S rRNA (guanine(966)-N(2))-methyltransferase RsmD
VVCFLRVISGKRRGLKLESLPGSDTRPTLDRVKEAIFSMLFDRCEGANALDLFAGSGGMGIEVLSRGGKSCTFVDFSKDAVEIVKTNVKKADFEKVSTIIYTTYEEYLLKCDEKFDIIFLDPPYMAGYTEKALRIIYERDLLSPDGIVVSESDVENIPSYSEKYSVIKQKNYGRVNVCLLEALWKK